MPLRTVTDAHIWTGDPHGPWAKHMTLADGRVESLGNISRDGETLHLPGAFILPGLIDSHAHLLMGGLFMQRLDLSGAKSRDDFDRLIALHAAQLAPDRWIEAFGWDEQHWDGTRPDLSWLRAAGDRPAIAWRCDQHVVLVNGRVLELLGLVERCDDIPGGTVVRDERGAATGLLLEQAAWKVLGPRIPPPTLAMRHHALREACAHFLSVGVTRVGAMEYLDDIENVFLPARADGSLTLRIAATVLDRERPLPFARADALHGDDFLRIIGFKSVADGTLGSSTASMLDRYSDAPASTTLSGQGVGSLMEHALEGTLTDWMREVLAAGYSPSVHAIGDRALEEVLRAATACDTQLRTRFEHAQTVHPDSVARFRGRLVSMQPFHKATDAPLARTRLGTHRTNRLFQFRSYLTHGARLAFGSDWPIACADPLEGMRVAITGEALDGCVYGANQNLTAYEAITAYTSGAAECLGHCNGAGHLNAGSPADFVALDRNPLACNWMDESPQVLLTVVNGVVRYDATGNHIVTTATA